MSDERHPLRRRDDHLVIASLQATAAFLEEQLRLLQALKVRDTDYLARMERTIRNVRKDLADRLERVEVRGHGGEVEPAGIRKPRVMPATVGEPKHKPKPGPKRPVLALIEGDAS